jgi:hypothetical protein
MCHAGAAIFSATETDKWKTNVVKSSLNPTWNRSVTITTRRNVDFFPVEVRYTRPSSDLVPFGGRGSYSRCAYS